jgi:regulator of sigma E protease
MTLLIVGILLFMLLVVAHEYGHFLLAKRNDVEVEEFGLGFPPKIYGRTMGKGIFKSYYSFNLLPLGGFVRLRGEHDADKHKGAYGAAKLPAKIRILLAGVTANFIIAFVMFTVVAMVGMPQVVDNQYKIDNDSLITLQEVIINYVEADSPAAKAGMVAGDKLRKIGTSDIKNRQQLLDATANYAGQAINVEYTRGDEYLIKEVNLLSEAEVQASITAGEQKGYLGVGSSEYVLAKATWSAPIVAVGSMAQFTALTLEGIGSALANLGRALFNAIIGHGQEAKTKASAAGENVSGPVGIFVILRQGATLGYQFTLFVIALLSLSLAIMNVLPIPALDGGKVFVTLLFRLFKKPLKPKTEDLIHGIGFAALMLLFILITVVDVKRFL